MKEIAEKIWNAPASEVMSSIQSICIGYSIYAILFGIVALLVFRYYTRKMDKEFKSNDNVPMIFRNGLFK
jgi:uncharacterized membrane protein